MTTIVALLSYSLLVVATLGAHRPDLVKFALILLSAFSALMGCCVNWPARLEPLAARIAPYLLGLIFGLQLSVYALVSALRPRLLGVNAAPILFGLLLLVFTSCTYCFGNRVIPRERFAIMLLIYAWLGGTVIINWPPPRIDVWRFEQAGAAALFHCKNPYSSVYPHLDPNEFESLYLKGGRVYGYLYPPLSLLLTLPGYVIGGDVRWSLLAASLGAAAVMVATGRKYGLPSGHVSELAAAAVLCNPAGLIIIDRGWTEPFVVLAFSLCAWAIASDRGRLLGFTLGAAVSMRQFGFFLAIPVAVTGKLKRSYFGLVIAVAVLIALPFFLLDPTAFWIGIVGRLASARYRPDSLSIPAFVLVASGYKISQAVCFLAAFAVAWPVVQRRPLPLSRAFLGGSAVYLLFFVFGQMAHIDYYWFCGSMLLLALIASFGEATRIQTQRMLP